MFSGLLPPPGSGLALKRKAPAAAAASGTKAKVPRKAHDDDSSEDSDGGTPEKRPRPAPPNPDHRKSFPISTLHTFCTHFLNPCDCPLCTPRIIIPYLTQFISVVKSPDSVRRAAAHKARIRRQERGDEEARVDDRVVHEGGGFVPDTGAV